LNEEQYKQFLKMMSLECLEEEFGSMIFGEFSNIICNHGRNFMENILFDRYLVRLAEMEYEK